jgi:hypothetical protein
MLIETSETSSSSTSQPSGLDHRYEHIVSPQRPRTVRVVGWSWLGCEAPTSASPQTITHSIRPPRAGDTATRSSKLLTFNCDSTGHGPPDNAARANRAATRPHAHSHDAAHAGTNRHDDAERRHGAQAHRWHPGPVPIDAAELVATFGAAVETGQAALFVGAGLSATAGLPGWGDLLAPLATDANVPTSIDDYPLLAEYIAQDAMVGRDQVNERILSVLTANPLEPSASHRLVAQLPVSEIWTTNYDPLLELSLPDASVVEVDALLPGHVRTQPTIIKLHGSFRTQPRPSWVSPPVITRADFENYELDRPRMWATLRASYLTRTMLFLGFGFRDPNVELLLRLARQTKPKNETKAPVRSQHIAVLTRPTRKRDIPLHGLRVRDLELSGVRVHEIARHRDLEPLLKLVVRRAQPPRLFVSGSGDDLDTWGERLAVPLTQTAGIQLVSLGGKAGWAVSRHVALLQRNRGDYDPHQIEILFRAKDEPAPELQERVGVAVYTDLDRDQLIQQALDTCRAMLVLGGGARTREEVRWAQQRGLGIVPLAATGRAAHRTWAALRADAVELGGAPVPAATWAQLDSRTRNVAVQAAVTLIRQSMYLS